MLTWSIYRLACLDKKLEPFSPFFPAGNINGAAPKGILYGTRLRQQTCSVQLQDLIFECLYERPSHRPTILELKARIEKGILTRTRAGGVLDEWYDMETPDPAAV